MASSYNRQPITFSMSGNYSDPALLTQAEFKGISIQKNYVTADAQTFVDAENVYTDEHGVLVSRAPFKFYDGEGYIVDEWHFGHFGLRLHRLPYEENGKSYFVFLLRCYTDDTISGTHKNHEIYDKYVWQIDADALGDDFVPKVTCAQIEEKVFIWFAGIDFLAFNTTGVKKDGKRYFYFEDAVKYLYFPVCKLIINGIESDLETKNFLTETYRRRHQYSALSSVDFNKYIGKRMSVNMTDTSVSKYLYDVTVQENQDKLMIYPYSSVDNDCYIDIVQTSNATVVLKYYTSTNSIQISFDGRYFRPVPAIDNILGNPLLTRDGFYLVAFTTTGVAKCKLVAQETTDFVDMSEVLVWEEEAYAKKAGISELTIDDTFIPSGYFETIDNYVYAFRRTEYVVALRGPTEEKLHDVVYAEWLAGTENKYTYFFAGFDIYENHKYGSDDVNLFFHYTALPESLVDGPLIIIANPPISLAYNGSKLSGINMSPVFVLHPRYVANDGTLSGFRYSRITHFDYSSIPNKNTAMFGALSKIESSAYTHYNVTWACNTEDNPGEMNDVLQSVTIVPEISADQPGHLVKSSEVCIPGRSKYFKLYENNLITDRYFLAGDDVVALPDNGELGPLVTDADRILLNGDNLLLALETDELFTFDRYIHRLTDDGLSLSASGITSGALISCKAEIFDTSEFLDEDAEQYYIEKLRVVENEFVVSEGKITQGQFIRLVSKTETYPQTPKGWKVNDDWPWTDIPKPVYITTNGFEPWKIGDTLPTGKITIYGVVNIKRKIEPLSIGANGVWYNVDGMLWTSQLSTDVMLELDEYMNAELDGNTYKVDVNIDVPDFHAIMHENYFVFTSAETGRHLLEVTSKRRDEEKLFDTEGTDLLLYMPKINEQKFSGEITNLHPLSDTDLGIFTENDIWHISMITNDDGSVTYSSPIKSKLPVGCRKGDDVVTALDGQALIFPTARGIAALAPQDFIATTEKTLTYLSDNISGMYDEFYTNSQIGIKTYKYWVLFYRYLGNEILFIDTRSGGWWKFTTPYPICSLTVDSRLRVMMQLNSDTESLLGVSYLFIDKESGPYIDDVVSGFKSEIAEGVVKDTSPIISWHFTSQRLHFNQINNYKAIKGITLNLKGDDTLSARLITKAYRDLLHPEKTNDMSIAVNEIRTFAKRLNILRVANFQYTLANKTDDEANYRYENDLESEFELNTEPPTQLMLDALTIKYEVKERIK